jgi:hypothetical protein
MSQRAAPPAFPEALDDDDDDVTWALQTAAVQWKRGATEDAVEWLYRAIESAVDGGRSVRARQIQKQVNALEAALRAGYRPSVAGSQAAPILRRGEADLNTELLDADAYTEVAVDLDIDIEEDTGLHTRPSFVVPEQRSETQGAEEILDDSEVMDAAEDLDAADAFALTNARAPYSVRESQPFLLPTEPEREPDTTREAGAEPHAEAEVDLPTEPPASSATAGEGYVASHSASPNSSRRQSEPEAEPMESGPPTQAAVLGHEDEEPTERSLEVAPAPESLEPSGRLPLTFREPPGDETTTRESATVPSDPAPSSRQRERESEPGTSPGLSPLVGAPESGPPTEPTREAADSNSARTPQFEQHVDVEAPAASEPPRVGGLSLSEVIGLEDLPEESQQTLVRSADIHQLEPNDEVSGFGLALVLRGSVSVMPAVADYAAAQVKQGELVFTQGHLENGVELRVVANPGGAELATWDAAEFDAAIADCPWVGDDLRAVGDRFQALSGVTMGSMGDQLDDMLRALVVERCEVRRLLPGEVIVEAGKPLPGMVVLGAGRLEIVESSETAERVLEELAPGDFLFANEILQASPAPATARAGKAGALVLFAERKIAHELLVSVPPLLGIFAQ